jgi:hypothetical protein
MKTPTTAHMALTLLFVLQIKIPETAGAGGKAGESCKTHLDCDQQSLLGCSTKSMTCECRPIQGHPLHYFKGQCVNVVGMACTKIQSRDVPNVNCVEHAMCVKVDPSPQETNGICFCKEGYHKTQHNFCTKHQPLPNSNALQGGIETPDSKGYGKGGAYPDPYPRSMSALASAPPSFKTSYLLTLVLLYGIANVF